MRNGRTLPTVKVKFYCLNKHFFLFRLLFREAIQIYVQPFSLAIKHVKHSFFPMFRIFCLPIPHISFPYDHTLLFMLNKYIVLIYFCMFVF